MKAAQDKAFTIVELLVAMALVVILMGLSGVIFTTGIKAYRAADSTVEIVRRAESINRQLVADVAGLQTDAPLAFWFERVHVDTDADGAPDTYRRYDQILFFANGNFQSMRQYNSQILRGNMSRIYYGHAWQVQTDDNAIPVTFTKNYLQSGLLSRRAHLLSSDMMLTYPGVPFPFPDATTTGQFAATFIPYANNRSEYDQLSLTEWKNLMYVQANCNQVLLRSFVNLGGAADFEGRPMIDMKKTDTLHLLLAEQISEFKVQWAYKSEDLVKIPATGETFLENEAFVGINWWPNADVDDFGAAGGINDSDFGVYFNIPGGENLSDWYPVTACQSLLRRFSPTFVPRALKFTFTVRDTKGLFPKGKTFTQIVYIN